MIAQFSAQINKAEANEDRTLKLKIDTQELSPEDTAVIFSFFQKQIWIDMAETSITQEQLNIPEVIDELEEKTPSERLRDRMFVYHKEKKVQVKFNDWYKGQMDKIGQNYLDKLNA